MARSYTVGELKTRARRAADFEYSNFIGDAELLDYINNSYASLYTLLVAKDENYYTTTGTLALTSGNSVYALPSDLYKVLAVEYQISPNVFVTLKRFNEISRNIATSQVNAIPAGTVRIRYVPQPAKFTSDTDTVDGIAGWEEYIVLDVAIQCLMKEESSTTAHEARLRRIMDRIDEAALNRDMLNSGTMGDVHRPQYFSSYTALRYRLYGTNIEFVSTEAAVLFPEI